MAVNQLQAFNLSNLVQGITEMLLLQNIGVFWGGYNYPLWYLSVLFTASIILFFLLRNLSMKVYNFVAVLCVVTVYSYLFYCGKIEIWDKCFIFYIPWWRGVADLFVGTLIYQINNMLNKCMDKYIREFHIIEIVCTVLLVCAVCIKDNEMLDFIAVFCIVVLVMIMSTPYSLYKKVPNLKLIRYEYAIYLNHAFCIAVLNKIFIFTNLDSINNMIKLLILLVITVIYSVFTTYIVERMIRAKRDL